MIFRRFNIDDFEQVKSLYKDRLNFNIDLELYYYLYSHNGEFYSCICEDDGKIIAHNAIIPRKYISHDKELTIGLFSGGMVNTNYSGIFFQLLKYCIKDFDGDGLIAFPNQQSEPFFSKLLKFNGIRDNYFNLNKKDLNLNFNGYHLPEITMHPLTLKNRLENHPRNNYFKLYNNKTFVIYKKYKDQADVMYVSAFNSDLVQILIKLFKKGFEEINLIYSEPAEPLSLGFSNKNNNTFYYRWLNGEKNNLKFNCQMVDSDIF